MPELDGWLLDLYPSPDEGLVLWLLTGEGRRRLRQVFPVTFYAAGPGPQLRELWRFLRAHPARLHLARQERRDLFLSKPQIVLAVTTAQPGDQPRLFQQAAAAFPELTYYDADLPISLRHAALYGTFPLAHCQVSVNTNDNVTGIRVLNSPWETDPEIPPLRSLFIEPDVDPAHAPPTCLHIRSERASYRLPLSPPRPLLINLRAILERHDPDLLLTYWGDTWLLPYLLEQSDQLQLPLPLNRDPAQQVIRKEARSYFAYGQVIYRGQQVHLYGRWHVDGCNAVLFHEYGMEGVFELGRVTALPIQTVARVSPGTGISAMQMITALRLGVLVPWHKQQAEQPQSALNLLHADQGGLVYQPTIGLHRDVAEIDFISMYPSIMAHFNISPETVGAEKVDAQRVPELELMISHSQPGLVPQTLQPLLDKRLKLKARLADLPAWDPRRTAYKARSTAHKWLLVTCFGYLGYKNARFGRIEAHEAVTAYGREALLRAKEAAEDLGYTVLHMYVDGLWVRKDGERQAADFQPLLEEILARTGLPIALDGVYRWVAFLPSRVDRRVPVPNRYFGLFQDGSFKLRGIEARRHDTPRFIKDVQMEMLELMGKAPQPVDSLPAQVTLLRRRLSELRSGRVPLERLLVTQTLSRTLEEYRSPSPVARAVAQLLACGKSMRPGQRVRFLFTRGEPGVQAWDAPAVGPVIPDLGRYITLLVRAASSIVGSVGVDEQTLRWWLFSNAGYGSRPGVLPPVPLDRLGSISLPLWMALPVQAGG